jgi:serine phosphatase RsbU (regulator of sigma subunit)
MGNTALCLSLHNGHVVISSAGHPPAMLVSADGKVREAPTPGPLLGAFADAAWPEALVPVGHNDLLLLYTDGVIDTPGPGERFGAGRLRELLTEHADAEPTELLAHLDAALDAFRNGPRNDDVAALALRPLG